MNRHFDADALAGYRVGLITGRRERQITAHLATCAQCASLAERLAEVSILLAAAPLPCIPDAVTSRIEAVLIAERASTSARALPYAEKAGTPGKGLPYAEQAGTSARALPSEQTVVTPARSRFRLPRLTPLRVLAPAATLLVLAATGFGLSKLGGSPASAPAVSGAAQPAAGPAAAGSSVWAPAAGSFATDHGAHRMAMGGTVGTLIKVSDTDLRPTALGGQLETLLKSYTQLPSTQASISVAACVRAVAAGRTVKLVASARYQGSAATVVIIDTNAGYQGLVAGPRCSAADSDVLATAVLPSGISAP